MNAYQNFQSQEYALPVDGGVLLVKSSGISIEKLQLPDYCAGWRRCEMSTFLKAYSEINNKLNLSIAQAFRFAELDAL